MLTTPATARYMATNLTKTLREQGRTARWVAISVGIHPSLLTHVSRGRRSIDGDKAAAIAELLDVPMVDIFSLADASAVQAEQ